MSIDRRDAQAAIGEFELAGFAIAEDRTSLARVQYLFAEVPEFVLLPLPLDVDDLILIALLGGAYFQ